MYKTYPQKSLTKIHTHSCGHPAVFLFVMSFSKLSLRWNLCIWFKSTYWNCHYIDILFYTLTCYLSTWEREFTPQMSWQPNYYLLSWPSACAHLTCRPGGGDRGTFMQHEYPQQTFMSVFELQHWIPNIQEKWYFSFFSANVPRLTLILFTLLDIIIETSTQAFAQRLFTYFWTFM